MTIEEQVKSLILEKYKSLRAFTISIDESYSSIDTLLKRENGINGAAIGRVIKMCRALDIDVDALAEGVIKPREPSLTNVDENDYLYLKKLEKLDNKVKDIVETIIDKEFEAKQHEDTNPHLLAANPRTENATQEEAQEKADALRKHVNKKKG